MCLMKTDTPAVTTVSAGRRVDLPDDVRFDGVGHTSSTFSEGRSRVCSKNTKKGCLKCDARLHSDRGKKCFEHYHSRCLTPTCCWLTGHSFSLYSATKLC